jgi:hypothetical protein
MVAGLISLAISAQTQTDSVAHDFAFETRDGQQGSLSAFVTDSTATCHTLLMFYDPDCTDCRQELFAMRHSSSLRRAVRQGRMQVLCVYAGDDEALWRETAGELPAAWTVAKASDADEIHTHYDLSAMPLLLLLDGRSQILQQGNEFVELFFKN